MHSLKPVLLGLFDGLLPICMAIYLNPMYGHLSNLYSMISHFTLSTNYTIFYTSLVSGFMMLPNGYSRTLKYTLCIITPMTLKYMGYYLMDYKTPSDLPNGVVYMLVMQAILLLLHYYASLSSSSNRVLYGCGFITGLHIPLNISPKQVHIVCLSMGYMIYLLSLVKKPKKVVLKKKIPKLVIDTSDPLYSFTNILKNTIYVITPVLCYLGSMYFQHRLFSPNPIKYSMFSTTGLIQVMHHKNYNMNALRAGHSLIGGTYTATNDCIWGSFYFHEFSRLINRPSHTPNPMKEQVVSIGVGIGITANSFGHLGYNTTAVDIDPIVLKAAVDYFNLKDVDLVTMGGREYLETLSNHSVDYLCHDVFTGGQSPHSLFSFEFFELVLTKLKPNGIFTINIVSHIVSPKNKPLRLLHNTLKSHFKHIHAYRDGSIPITSVQNIVFYCTLFNIKYREPTFADHQNSNIRRFVLDNMNKFKLDLSELEPINEVLRDDNNLLNSESFDQQFDHWSVMNEMVHKRTWLQFE